MRDRQCETHCYRRVDRVAAIFQYRQTNIGGKVLLRHYHSVFGTDRLLRDDEGSHGRKKGKQHTTSRHSRARSHKAQSNVAV